MIDEMKVRDDLVKLAMEICRRADLAQEDGRIHAYNALDGDVKELEKARDSRGVSFGLAQAAKMVDEFRMKFEVEVSK